MTDKKGKPDNQNESEEIRNPFKEKDISTEETSDTSQESTETAAAEQQRKEALTERD